MNLTSLVTALPDPSNTGWGKASKRINEELKKIALVQDLNEGNLLKQDFPVDLNVPLIQAVRGVDMLPLHLHLKSERAIGYGFCEDNLLLRQYARNIPSWWNVIAVGSHWAHFQMEMAMQEYNDEETGLVIAIQGVDTDVFCPSPPDNSAYNEEFFTIFSGGKFEYRKAQDVVIRAVAVMMERHKDVRLIASWWNPWPQTQESMRASKVIDLTGTLMNHSVILGTNGVKNFELVTERGPADMALQMNRCDVAVFPNRCEAGTNLVMMEAMACGLPVIATVNHGHKDVTNALGVYQVPSEKFTHVREGFPVGEWYEPDLKAVIYNLELAYAQWQSGHLEDMGKHNRELMKQFTWANCAKNLLGACQ